jgi:hypothetical protein
MKYIICLIIGAAMGVGATRYVDDAAFAAATNAHIDSAVTSAATAAHQHLTTN